MILPKKNVKNEDPIFFLLAKCNHLNKLAQNQPQIRKVSFQMFRFSDIPIEHIIFSFRKILKLEENSLPNLKLILFNTE